MEDLLNLPCHCPLNFSEAARNRGLAARHKKVLRGGCPAVLHPHCRAAPLTRARAQDLRPRLYVAVDRTEAPPSQGAHPRSALQCVRFCAGSPGGIVGLLAQAPSMRALSVRAGGPGAVIATEKQSILLREFYRIGLNHAVRVLCTYFALTSMFSS